MAWQYIIVRDKKKNSSMEISACRHVCLCELFIVIANVGIIGNSLLFTTKSSCNILSGYQLNRGRITYLVKRRLMKFPPSKTFHKFR